MNGIWKALLFGSLSLLLAARALAGPVNVNSADAETIAAELKGVGAAKAEAIVAFRKANGRFESVEQLALVKGIGRRLVELNRDNILLDDRD